MSAAAVESNFDPIVAIKVVIIALPPNRSGEVLKTRLDLFFAANSEGLIGELSKAADKTKHKKIPSAALLRTSQIRQRWTPSQLAAQVEPSAAWNKS